MLLNPITSINVVEKMGVKIFGFGRDFKIKIENLHELVRYSTEISFEILGLIQNSSKFSTPDDGNTKESLFQNLVDSDDMKIEASYVIVWVRDST